jgi:hypothetical protein
MEREFGRAYRVSIALASIIVVLTWRAPAEPSSATLRARVSDPPASDALHASPPCAPADPAGGVECVPIDPATRRPYTHADATRFAVLHAGCRAAGICEHANLALPRLLGEAEYLRRRGRIARTAILRRQIHAGEAGRAEIDEYYSYVNQTNHDKQQIAEYLIASKTGDAGTGDLLAELKREEEILYLAKRNDLRRAGVTLDLERSGAAESVVVAYERARLDVLWRDAMSARWRRSPADPQARLLEAEL